jgi:hypothetical protein
MKGLPLLVDPVLRKLNAEGFLGFELLAGNFQHTDCLSTRGVISIITLHRPVTSLMVPSATIRRPL